MMQKCINLMVFNRENIFYEAIRIALKIQKSFIIWNIALITTMTKHSNNLRLRPRFKIEIPMAPEQAVHNLREVYSKNPSTCILDFVSNHITLKIPAAQQRYWSPQMQLELEPTPTGTLIRGLIGPKPGIWTMFVFFYSGIGFLTMLGAMFGLSQMMLKMSPWALWSVPVGLFIIFCLYLISHIGQQLSKDQIGFLHDYLDSAINVE
jgi:hypothetical protein